MRGILLKIFKYILFGKGHGEILMGKNTMIRKAIRGHLQKNPQLEKLLPYIVGNVGFVFTSEDLAEIRKKLLENKRVKNSLCFMIKIYFYRVLLQRPAPSLHVTSSCHHRTREWVLRRLLSSKHSKFRQRFRAGPSRSSTRCTSSRLARKWALRRPRCSTC